MKKLTRKQIKEFNNEVLEILRFYDVQLDDSDIEYCGTSYYIDSEKIGRLNIKLDTDLSSCYTIYAKFSNTEKAINYFKVRPYNGKVNIHTYNKEEAISYIDDLLYNYNLINGIDKLAV